MLKINKRIYFFALSAILMLLILLRYSFQINIPRFVLTVLIAAMAVLCKKEDIFAVLMCCIPMHNAINFYATIVLCAVIFVFKNYSRFRVDRKIILLLVMIIYELSHGFAADFSFKLFFVDISVLFVLAVVLSIDLSHTNYALVVRMMAVYSVLMGLMLLINVVIRANGNWATTLSNLQRLGALADDETMIGGAINPNSLGIINLLAVSGLMQLSVQGRRQKVDIYLIVLLLMFGTLTLSRTFLTCLLAAAILWIVGQPGTITKKIKTSVSFIVIAGLIIILIVLIFPDTLNSFAKRFHTSDITGERNTIAVDYHKFITGNPNIMFFGIGLNNFAERILNIYRASTHVPHNCIQEIIVVWGIPGLILWAFLLGTIIIEAKKYNSRKTILNYIPLVILLAKSMAGQLLTSGYTMLALLFAYLSLCQDFKETPVSV